MLKDCVVVADRARARLLVTEMTPERGVAEFALTELEALTNPEGEMTGNEVFSNTRSGTSRAPSGNEYQYDDHRDSHREEVSRRFANEIADRVLSWVRTEHPARLILAAEHRMLGLLRKRLVDELPSEVPVFELAKELSWHTPDRIQATLLRHGAWR